MNSLAHSLATDCSSHNREIDFARTAAAMAEVKWEKYAEARNNLPFQRCPRVNEFLFRLENAVDFEDTDLIESVDRDALLDLVCCVRWLRALAEIDDGWHEGAGRRPTRTAVVATRELLKQHMRVCGAFSICPTPVSGIMFEFDWNGWDLSIEFNSAGRVMLDGVEIDGDGEIMPAQFVPLDKNFHSLLRKVIGADDTWTECPRTKMKNSIVRSIRTS